VKRVIVALMAIALVGCATLFGSSQQTQATLYDGCVIYDATLKTVVAAAQAGKLSQDQLKQVKTVTDVWTPICTQKVLPSDPATAVADVTAAAITLVVKAGLTANQGVPK